MKNEIAFVLSDVPNGRAIARTFLVDKSNKYTLNQRIAGITPLDETYPYFLHILMNRNRYFLSFDDGAKQTNLSVSDVMNFEEMYPSYDEQKRIGKFFNNLDNLITLQQREHQGDKVIPNLSWIKISSPNQHLDFPVHVLCVNKSFESLSYWHVQAFLPHFLQRHLQIIILRHEYA